MHVDVTVQRREELPCSDTTECNELHCKVIIDCVANQVGQNTKCCVGNEKVISGQTVITRDARCETKLSLTLNHTVYMYIPSLQCTVVYSVCPAGVSSNVDG